MKNNNVKNFKKIAVVLLSAVFLPEQLVFALDAFKGIENDRQWSQREFELSTKNPQAWNEYKQTYNFKPGAGQYSVSGYANGQYYHSPYFDTQAEANKWQNQAQVKHWEGMVGPAAPVVNAWANLVNPVITARTGIQPGSAGAYQAAMKIDKITSGGLPGGGILSVWTKLMFGKDLGNPYADTLQSWDRITKQDPLAVGKLALVCLSGGYGLAGLTGGATVMGTTGVGTAALYGKWMAIGAGLDVGLSNLGSYATNGKLLSLDQNIEAAATGGFGGFTLLGLPAGLQFLKTYSANSQLLSKFPRANSFLNWYLNPSVGSEILGEGRLINIAARSVLSGVFNTAAANTGSYFFTGETLSLEQNLLIFGTAAGSNILSNAIFPVGLNRISSFQNSTLWWKPIIYQAAKSALTSAPSVGTVFVDFANAAYGNINTYATRKPNTPAPDFISDLFLKPYYEGFKNGLIFGAWIGPLGSISPNAGTLAKIASKVWSTSSPTSYLTLPATSFGIRLGLAPLFGEEYFSKENIDGATDWATSAFLVRLFTAKGIDVPTDFGKPQVNQDSLSPGRLPAAAATKELPSEIPLTTKPKITPPITEADNFGGFKIGDKVLDTAKLSETILPQKQAGSILKESLLNTLNKEILQNNEGFKLTTLATLSINPQVFYAINPSFSKELFLGTTNAKLITNLQEVTLQNSVTPVINNGLVPGNTQLPSVPEKRLPLNQRILDLISQNPVLAAIEQKVSLQTKLFSPSHISNVIVGDKTADFIIKNSIGSGIRVGKELLLGHVVRPVTGNQVGTNLFEDTDAIQRLEDKVIKHWMQGLNPTTIK